MSIHLSLNEIFIYFQVQCDYNRNLLITIYIAQINYSFTTVGIVHYCLNISDENLGLISTVAIRIFTVINRRRAGLQ